ncbi:hypothetical protein L6164_014870 [Bauhinia variegata]|uniref:Uncharacterized protein n=1 Tax=Bauhinia variegata TaxID=167791 RepID=A0ACB9NK50_BAUVA|nr:hypothetical protein L6164_014870 [Bauhinia variegata]
MVPPDKSLSWSSSHMMCHFSVEIVHATELASFCTQRIYVSLHNFGILVLPIKCIIVARFWCCSHAFGKEVAKYKLTSEILFKEN